MATSAVLWGPCSSEQPCGEFRTYLRLLGELRAGALLPGLRPPCLSEVDLPGSRRLIPWDCPLPTPPFCVKGQMTGKRQP